MGKRASRDIDFTLNAVALECNIANLSLDITQETIKADGFCDAGPRMVVGNYNWGINLDGQNDFDTGSVDATLWGMLGSTGVTQQFEPTGSSTPAASTPVYSGQVVLGSYSIRAGVGALVGYNANLPGHSALTRATS